MVTPEQIEALRKLTLKTEQLSQLQMEYWQQYANIDTWGFKIILLMFVLPLVWLYFAIDRKNILLLGFYGLNIHVWFSYINIAGVRQGFFSYPYELIPFIPGNLALDAALIPVLFMLVYQWTIKHNKNFYLYSLLLSAVLSFVFKPIIVSMNMFVLHKGTNYLILFILYCIIFLFSKVITNIFLKLQRNPHVAKGDV